MNKKTLIIGIFFIIFSLSLINSAHAILWTISNNSTWENGSFLNTSNVQATGNLELTQLVDDYFYYARHDDCSGTTLTEETNINNLDANITGAIWNSTGKYGCSLIYDGLNDFTTINNESLFEDESAGTILLWVKPTDISKAQDTGVFGDWMLTSANNYIQIVWDDSENAFSIRYNDGSSAQINGITQPSNNIWYFIEFFWNSSRNELWFNDTFQNSATPSDGIISNTKYPTYGNYYDTANRYFQGEIDDVRVYYRVLSKTEINQSRDNYHKTLGNYTTECHDSGSSNNGQNITASGNWDNSTTFVDVYVDKCDGVFTLVKTDAINGSNYNIPSGDRNHSYSVRTSLRTTQANQTPIETSIEVWEGISTGVGDITNPTVTLNTPLNNISQSSTNMFFNATISDNINATNAILWGNFSGAWSSNITNNTCNPASGLSIECTFNITGLNPGFYVWNIQGFDNSSNSAFATSNFSFYIDIEPPTCNTPPDASYNQSESASINWICIDNGPTGLYNITRNGSLQNESLSWINNTNLGVWVNSSINGTWIYIINITDSENNKGIGDTVIIQILSATTTTTTTTTDRKSTRLNSSHIPLSRMPSSA